MPHEETSAKPCFQLYSQHSREENLTFGNLINTKLTDGFGLYKIVCLSFLSCFPPWDPANTTLCTCWKQWQTPGLEREVKLGVPCPQPTPTEQFVSPWMQCVSVFKKCCSWSWHLTKVTLKFPLKERGRDASGEVQHRYSEPHCKAS